MSQERREKKAAREAAAEKQKVGPTGLPVPRLVWLTTPDGNRAVPPETMLVRLVREEGMGFAVLLTDRGLFRAKQADQGTPGRWHEMKPV